MTLAHGHYSILEMEIVIVSVRIYGGCNKDVRTLVVFHIVKK